MSLPSLTGVITVAVLIVPGFYAFLVVKKLVPSKQKKFSDYEMTIYSLMYALPILATYCLATGTNGIDDLATGIFNVYNLALLFGLALFWGLSSGLFARLVVGRNQVISECWDEFGKRLGDGSYVLVYTEDGREYKGWICFYDHSEGKYELIIGDPKLILRDKNWKVLKEIKTGQEMLFTQKDIRRIASLKPTD